MTRLVDFRPIFNNVSSSLVAPSFGSYLFTLCFVKNSSSLGTIDTVFLNPLNIGPLVLSLCVIDFFN